jgi:hypothetical protein
MAAGITDRLWDLTDIVKVLEDWEANVATAGTIYSVENDRIGEGFHVRIQPRYGVVPSVFGFKTVADAEVFIEAERQSIGRDEGGGWWPEKKAPAGWGAAGARGSWKQRIREDTSAA